jgi:MoxR-like ATPase
LVEGRVHVSYDDVEAVIYPALRHRLILNFQAEAENVSPDRIIAALLRDVGKD